MEMANISSNYSIVEPYVSQYGNICNTWTFAWWVFSSRPVLYEWWQTDYIVMILSKVFAFDSKTHYQIKGKVNIWINWLYIFLNWGTIIDNNCLSGLQEIYYRLVVFRELILKISYGCLIVSSWDSNLCHPKKHTPCIIMHTINHKQKAVIGINKDYIIERLPDSNVFRWVLVVKQFAFSRPLFCLFIFFRCFFSNRVGPKRLEGIDIFHWM